MSEEPELMRDLLDAAREDGPSEPERAELEASLGALLGPPGGGSGGPPNDGGAGVGTSGAGLAAGAAGLAIVVAAVLGYLAIDDEPPAPQPAPRGDLTLEPEEPEEPAAPDPVAAAPDGPGDVEPEPAPAPASVEPAPRQPALTPPSELELIAEARRAMASSPARALRQAERHRRAYPRGELEQEREVIAIEALHRLGRDRPAARRAERFLGRYAGSPYREQVRRLVGD